MFLSFNSKLEDMQKKQLDKILNSNLSNIPKACKKMGFKPLKVVNGVHIANRGKVFDSIIVGSANNKTYTVMVRKGGDFVPLTDPENKINDYLDEVSFEGMNKSQMVITVATKISELLHLKEV